MRFVFSDTETSGAKVRYDQAFQFAAVVTDENFRELERINLRCRLLPHVIPSVGALLVTGVDPHDLARAPLSHYEFAREIHRKMSAWGPAVYIGYNSIPFDEEVLRQTFWQNLLDPYVTSARGSFRADLRPILQVARAIDANLLVQGVTESGNPSFKLEELARLNGFPDHNAHDALGDVFATIHLARFVRERRPDAWARMLDNADPRKLAARAESARTLLFMTHFGQPRVHQVVRCAAQPSNAKSVVLFDLAHDPAPYLAMPAEQIADALFVKDSPFHRIRTNAMPCLFEAGALPLAPSVSTDAALVQHRRDLILADAAFRQRVGQALELRAERFAPSTRVEEQIYDGFPSRDDRKRMEEFHQLPDWAARYAAVSRFEDKRLRTLAVRLVYANAREILPEQVRAAATRSLLGDRLLAEGDVPWTTIKTARAELLTCEETPALAPIRAWLDKREQEARAMAPIQPVREARMSGGDALAH